MVVILDGNSEKGWSDLGYLTYLRHLFRSAAASRKVVYFLKKRNCFPSQITIAQFELPSNIITMGRTKEPGYRISDITNRCSLAYLELRMTVDLEPVGADEVLLVEHRVVRAQEVEVLELKQKTIVTLAILLLVHRV